MPFIDSYLVGGQKSDVVKIAEVPLTGSSTTVSNIPQIYRHLKAVIVSRNTDTGNASLLLRLNGNTSQVYYAVDGTNTNTVFAIPQTTTASSEPTWFSLTEILIGNYTDTTMAKMIHAAHHLKSTLAAAGTSQLKGCIFGATAAVTSITLITSLGFAEGSRLSVYGVK